MLIDKKTFYTQVIVKHEESLIISLLVEDKRLTKIVADNLSVLTVEQLQSYFIKMNYCYDIYKDYIDANTIKIKKAKHNLLTLINIVHLLPDYIETITLDIKYTILEKYVLFYRPALWEELEKKL